MPTPYGSRGGMAFSAEELRVLGDALAAVLQQRPGTQPGAARSGAAEPGAAEPGAAQSGDAIPAAQVRACARLAAAMEEAAEEGRRLRAFQRADLDRYRAALPGSAAGYLTLLADALAAGCLPRPDDLTALRTLPALAVSTAEAERRTALLRRCERLAEQSVRARLLVPRGTPPIARPESKALRALT